MFLLRWRERYTDGFATSFAFRRKGEGGDMLIMVMPVMLILGF